MERVPTPEERALEAACAEARAAKARARRALHATGRADLIAEDMRRELEHRWFEDVALDPDTMPRREQRPLGPARLVLADALETLHVAKRRHRGA